MTMYHEGRPMAEIQRAIDDRYAHKYLTRTPTAKPPAPKDRQAPQQNN
jgi:hypothetical protein